MPRVKDDEKRQRILGRAKRLFAKPGNQDATLKELSRLSEMTPSSLYTYFTSKEEIIRAVIDDCWDWLTKEIKEEEKAGKPNKERLQRLFCQMYLPEMLADKNLTALIIQYPHVINDIDAKLETFYSMMEPGLQALSEKYNTLPVDNTGRKAQCTILVLGCLCASYFAENANLGFSEKDILNAFRAFLEPTKA